MKIMIAAVLLVAFAVLSGIDAAPQTAPHGYESYDVSSSPVPHGYGDYVSSSTVKAALNGYEAYDSIQQADDTPHGYESYSTTTEARPNGY